MKTPTKTLLISAAFLFSVKHGSTQSHNWSFNLGSSANETVEAITTDNTGNVIATGSFRNTVDFNPGNGVANLTANGEDDIFIAKYDANGNYIWAHQIGAQLEDRGYDVTTDNANNIYVTGCFRNIIDADPTSGNWILWPNGAKDIFVIKLDANGNFIWAMNIGDNLDDCGYGIEVDASQNVYLTGYFQNTADFNYWTGTYNVTSNGGRDMFLAKFLSNGHLDWVFNIGGTAWDEGKSIELDDGGNIALTGYFDGVADFDPSNSIANLTTNGFQDIFVAKYSNAGLFNWAKQIGGTAWDIGYDLATDAGKNIYVTGDFNSTVDFNPNAGVNNLTSNGSRDIFALKLDPLGNYQWAFNVGSAGNDIGQSISLDASEYPIITGFITNTVDADPSGNTFNLTSNGSSDAFAGRYDQAGNLDWAFNIGSSSNDGGNTVHVDGNGIYIGGEFTGTTDFDHGSNTTNIASAGGNDGFIAKYNNGSCSGFSATSFVSSNNPCYGGCNAIVCSTPAGGTAPYAYQWSSGGNAQCEFGLCEGTYTVTITDDNGCTTTTSVTVTNPTQINTTAMANDATCGNNNGTASANATGGTSPYAYQWSNSATSQNITGLSAGSYSVTVTDDNGCTDVQSITINQAGAPTATATGNDATCGHNNGTASANATGGTSPYAYQWSNSATSQNITGLSAGSYSVTVTDDNGCTDVQSVTINQAGTPTATATSNDATCGNNNGTASANATGGTSPYTYQWSNSATSQNITGLSAGSYSVTITDDNGCTDVQSVTINQDGSPTATATANDATCGNSNGSASASATGGTSPYTYAWSNSATSQNISGLSAGSYSVTVTDDNGCTDVQSVTINQAGAPTATSTANDATCGNSNGSASANATGGTSPYAYEWSNTSTSQNVSGLAAGTYSVTVTDDNGCTDVQSIVINQAGGPTGTATTNDATCGNNNGTASANATGGTSPYTYQWSNSATSQNVTGLSAGTYSVTVTDDNGCIDVQSITVNQAGAPTATATNNDATCGNNNGTASANATGGTSPYTYAWSNSATSQNISGLSAGSYSITVTDDNGCTDVQSVTINQDGSPTATATSNDATCGNSNGSASANATGGTSPYTYQWSNSATSQNINGLSAGSYSVTVTDDNGCTDVQNVTINQDGAPTATVTANDATCGNSNGSASANATGGTSPYTYQWSNSATSQNINGLSAGSYSVTVTDDNGCTNVQSVTIGNASAGTATISTINIDCFQNCNGSATVSMTGGTPPFTYNWSNGGTNQTENGLCAGNYLVTITDDNGCTVTTTTVVTEPQQLTATVSGNDETCGSSNGFASVNANGGTLPYSYNWSNSETSQTITNLAAGTYNVTVTDDNGCTSVESVTINNAASPTVTLGNDTSFCFGSSIALNAGSNFVNYSWSSGHSTQVISVNATGTYEVTVTDGNGCTGTDVIDITVHPLPEPNLGPDTMLCLGSVMSLTPGNFVTYDWSSSETTSSIIYNETNVGTQTVWVTVTDSNGCANTDSINITIEECVGIIETNLLETISIYPNPSAGLINLNFGKLNGETTVSVINQLGKEVNRQTYNSNKHGLTDQLDMGVFGSGLYYLVVRNGQEAKTFRVVIQK